MHYYHFNIADYRKDTGHLSIEEHYIYRYLIDWYYLDESPIPKKTQVVSRRLGLGSSGLLSLQNVLNDFFELKEKGWVHKRIEADLSKYRQKADIAKVNGSKGGRPKGSTKKPRKTQVVNLANPEITGSKPNQEPITNNILKGKFTPPSATEVAEYAKSKQIKIDAQHFVDHYQTNGWMRGKNKIKDWKACVRTWGRNNSTMQNQQQPQQRPLIKSNLNEILR